MSLAGQVPAVGALYVLSARAARRLAHGARGTGGTDSPRYCYGVWLRHLVTATAAGLEMPRQIAELGPGDSIGVGIAALLSGAETYSALDVEAWASAERNVAVFDGLVDLFRRRARIPGPEEFPEVLPHLPDYAFPDHILGSDVLDAALEPDRVAALRDGIASGSGVRYVVPWDDPSVIRPGSLDAVISQAVLEHVVDVRHTHRAVSTWLRPGGFASHQVDFRSHQMSVDWNGQWSYGRWLWRVVNSRRKPINREPISTHLRALETAGMDLVALTTAPGPGGLTHRQLHPDWRWLDDRDLSTAGAHILAVKRR